MDTEVKENIKKAITLLKRCKGLGTLVLGIAAYEIAFPKSWGLFKTCDGVDIRIDIKIPPMAVIGISQITITKNGIPVKGVTKDGFELELNSVCLN